MNGTISILKEKTPKHNDLLKENSKCRARSQIEVSFHNLFLHEALRAWVRINQY